MASRVDEMIYDESIDLDEIERKKIYKQRKEKKRVENLGIAYEKLAAKMASVHSGNEHGGRRRTPSRLSVLASALAHIKDLRQQMHMVANTSDSSDGEPTFRISQIPTAVTTVDRSSSSRRRRQGSSSTESSQYQSSSDSSLEITPTGLMPVYGGASDVLPSQVSLNYFSLSCQVAGCVTILFHPL